MFWLLSREVLRLRGTISRAAPWDVAVDLFFYRDPEELEKAEEAQNEDDATARAGWKDAATAQPVEAEAPEMYEPEEWSAAPAAQSEWTAQAPPAPVSASNWDAPSTAGASGWE